MSMVVIVSVVCVVQFVSEISMVIIISVARAQVIASAQSTVHVP